MASRKRSPHISVSAVRTLQRCPRQWFFTYRTSVPKQIDLPRLCGIGVHQMVKLLYKPTKDNRPFYYKSVRSFQRAWSNCFDRILEVWGDRIIDDDPQKREEFRRVGYICLAQYWKDHFGHEKPLEVEVRYQTPYHSDINLLGILDQVRRVDLKWIELHRPNLIKDKRLIEAFDPVII